MNAHFSHRLLSILLLIVFISCHNEKIESGESLNKETTVLIKSLGLLSDGEQIIKYYSNFNQSRAGSFFTNKRIAHYWLDGNDKSKNDTNFAFYSDIARIDTSYTAPDTYTPFMTITRKDSTQFSLYVEGTKEELKSFFEEAISTWRTYTIKKK